MTPPRNRQLALRTSAAFTNASRTPWGGTRLAALYGDALALESGAQVGEAWVFSLDPSFPSTVEGAALATHVESTLLVKLLDAAQPLSVQIHPADDYAGLREGESGKPEAWYVVSREPGAGLFLGFLPGVDEASVRRALDGGDDLSALMHFVAVEPGDFFVIDAGTPHAVGAGVTLVEPQRVIAGWAGVTYRYWDWNRRYDAAGQPASAGAPRELHVEHALAVTDWARVTHRGFVDSLRVRAGTPQPASAGCRALTSSASGPRDGAAERAVCAREGAPSGDLRGARLAGSGVCPLPNWRDWGVGALTVLSGSVALADGPRVGPGETLALLVDGDTVALDGAHALVMAARPGERR